MDENKSTRNPVWSRDELVLALDLYLRFRRALPSKTSREVVELSEFLGRMGQASGLSELHDFRNANGVYMKMMNFRRFDPEYTSEGRVGLTRGNKEEENIWNQFHDNPDQLRIAVDLIKSTIDAADKNIQSGPYWVFVCNPKRWAIDRFLERRVDEDQWGVRPSDQARFAPGQLGIVRVGIDPRTAAERNGNPPLQPGIYALG